MYCIALVWNHFTTSFYRTEKLSKMKGARNQLKDTIQPTLVHPRIFRPECCSVPGMFCNCRLRIVIPGVLAELDMSGPRIALHEIILYCKQCRSYIAKRHDSVEARMLPTKPPQPSFVVVETLGCFLVAEPWLLNLSLCLVNPAVCFMNLGC